ncbi:hypothetical protein JCM33374_g302 [Metschnikowia sp. JCM 33374]|nr:hypothetical protein JCM33374_g302 [Metschnikowia sp. JCM 33374]
MTMELSPITNWSLPEAAVSEDGTFCDSFNDTISKLEHGYEIVHSPEVGASKTNACQHSPGKASESPSNWEQKSEFVDPVSDQSSLNSQVSATDVIDQSAHLEPLVHEISSDTTTTSDTPIPDGAALKHDSGAKKDDMFTYNNHNESIFDDERYFPSLRPEQTSVVKFDGKNPECIVHATLKALLVQLTSPEVIDYNLICDFFLTYRTFTDAHSVMNLLLTRLIWSLQYVNSPKQETQKLGKLVLLRTFVVLRHWILNYFFDDFESDEVLCDLFAFQINKITAHSGLIAADMVFEHKIFADIKTHWLSQIKTFFNRSFTSTPTSVFSVPLPMSPEYFNLKKLNSSFAEGSFRTNASFRRSAMLSLYDQKIHHKCIVHDASASASASAENLSLPIANLVNQHKSSRMSLDNKIKDYYTQGARRDNIKFAAASRRQPLAPRHNYSSLKDSSLALKKTANIPPANLSLVIKKDDLKAGFSTNGRVKLPSARINTIVPLSPVKKMSCSLKEEAKPAVIQDADAVGRKKSIKKIVEGWTKSLHSPEMPSNKSTFSSDHPSNSPDSNYATSPIIEHRDIGDRIDVLSARIVDELEFVIRYYILDSRQTTPERDSQKEPRKLSVAFSPTKTEFLLPAPLEKLSTGPGVEPGVGLGVVLGAGPGAGSGGTLEKAPTRESLATTNKDMSLHDISELNIEKIDNLFSQSTIGEMSDELGDSFNSQTRKSHVYAAKQRASRGSKRSTFGGRVTSINWNDDGNLLLENSTSVSDTSQRPETKFYDVSTDLNKQEMVPQSKMPSETPSSDVSYSDMEHYGSEVSDLGIAMSPRSPRKRSTQRLSLHDQFTSGTLGKAVPALARNSTESSSFRHESMKSYMTYDSALSAISESSRNEQYSSNLKKKTGCHDLRKLAEKGAVHPVVLARLSASSNVSSSAQKLNRASLASHVSKASSMAKKNVRLSTLCALTELPFNSARDSYASMSTRALFQDETARTANASVSSVFSNAPDAGKESKTTSDSKNESNRLSSASVAIPGISTNILRELAAIPDESFSSKNPIQCALYKLEGKPSAAAQQRKSAALGSQSLDDISFNRSALIDGNEIPAIPAPGLEASQTPEQKTHTTASDRSGEAPARKEETEQKESDGKVVVPEADHKPSPSAKTSGDVGDEHEAFQNTEDILDEINNAVTEDAIGYSSDIEDELKQRPITPINTRSKSTLLVSQSNSTPNCFYPSVAASESGRPHSLLNPKLVLDGYYLASEKLCVKEVMAAGSHVSFILSYDSKTIAEHFTLIERDMLEEIDWKELIELKWNKDLTPVNSWLEIIVNDEYYNKNKGVNLVIARFNLVVNWIISEILLTKSEDERREIVSKFIHIAHRSYEMQNFSTLMQVVLALTSEKVNKLKSTWKNLSPGDILTLKHLEQVTSPSKNFINMRVSTNSIKPSKGCIPFVGLYLSDLIFNAERPKFVKLKSEPKTGMVTSHENASELSLTQGESTLGSSSGVELEKMINFSRFRTSVHIVKSLSQSIEWAQNYNVAVDEELLRKCLYIKSLDEAEMNFCLDQPVNY